jgi:two-component system, OmpR family, response regulator
MTADAGLISGISGRSSQYAEAARTTTNRSTRVLVVDDDPSMKHMLVNYLEQRDMRVIATSLKQEVIRQFAVDEPSVVILDLRLGQEDGLDLLREIRARSDVPVIISTGHRRDEIDRVVGLELGADDYVTKPFGVRELLARIRAGKQVASPHSVRPVKAAADLAPGSSTAARAGLPTPRVSPVVLTKGEYALLIAFLDAPQRPLTREHLLQATRVHEDVFDRSIDVQILRLRRKLETDPSAPNIIQTERGVGYIFALPVERL